MCEKTINHSNAGLTCLFILGLGLILKEHHFLLIDLFCDDKFGTQWIKCTKVAVIITSFISTSLSKGSYFEFNNSTKSNKLQM